MALGDGIRYNIASVDPTERALLRDAFIELNHRYFPGSRTDQVPGGVSWWFKQDEIHHGTHVHDGPEFIPWHREITNRLEEMLRQINPQLSLHYWDWTQDPRNIPNANLGNGTTDYLDLFTPEFMGEKNGSIGEPWLSAGYYVPDAANYRSDIWGDTVNNNPADPPQDVHRVIARDGYPLVTEADDNLILEEAVYPEMRVRMIAAHDKAHGFVFMGYAHTAFRDPFVFLLHSNVDRLFARWQTNPQFPERLDPILVYGTEVDMEVPVEGIFQNLDNDIEPWSTGETLSAYGQYFVRPWCAPELQGQPRNYKDPSIVYPPCYDTNLPSTSSVQVMNIGTPPVINFNDVPTGETTMRAAVFRVYTCGSVKVKIKQGFEPAAPFSIMWPLSHEVPVDHSANLYTEARIWFDYTAGPAGVQVPDGSVTIECVDVTQGSTFAEFTFVLRANAVPRETVAVMMALDQSGSMGWPAGTSGYRRYDVLRKATGAFMDVIQKDNGVGLIRFDNNSYAFDDATYPGLPITKMTSDGNDQVRDDAVEAAKNHQINPAGGTSVGDGVARAQEMLKALPAADYAKRALIVLTDGVENDPLWISDVTNTNDGIRTFAIGLGNQLQVNTAPLADLAESTGGVLFLTGELSSSIDDSFRLQKFFQQILADVTDTGVIIDPAGFIAPGVKVRVPFSVCDADIDCTVLLMTDEDIVDLAVEAPDGTLIDPAMAAGLGITYGVGNLSKHYRFTLPVIIGEGQREGVWYAVLEVNKDAYTKTLWRMRKENDANLQSFGTHGAKYCVVAQTYSNLRMSSTMEQSSFQPGADLLFGAVLTEYGIPIENRADVRVELTRPSGSLVTLPMTEIEPGTFEVTTKAVYKGVYQARIMAKGVTLRGRPFTREGLATAAVWRGGDNRYQPPRGRQGRFEAATREPAEQ